MTDAARRIARHDVLAFDLACHNGDRFLIDASGIPFLDHGEIRLPLLITNTRTPAFLTQEIRGRRKAVCQLCQVNSRMKSSSE